MSTLHPVRVGLVGLGVIGAVHRDVLAARDDVRLVFVADPRLPRDATDGVPRFGSVDAALDAGIEVDLVVVATPTDTHLDVVGQVLEKTDADVLSEKPIGRDPQALRRFAERHADDVGRVRVVNHFAFSPEIVWAADAVATRGWGPPRHVLSCFDDPYVAKTPDERRSYVSSWVDSGANQFAFLARFAGGWSVTAHDADADGLRSVTEVAFDGGTGTLTTNWWTGASSKQTTLRWDEGRELVLDHTSMTGVLLDGGRVREHLGNDGTVDRKTAHYTAMYRAVLDGTEGELLGFPFAAGITGLLAATAPQRSGVAWTLTGGA
ncbi:MAG TPA: Gfo/Idh/MocA family oxidoreductase [Kineosporiaceae bacterium]|nr:Gfo/Idh/MocA family oxidoreductase [Kineosporiaceae bacterium]